MKKLDLHGVRHIDVANTVKRFIEDNWTAAKEVEIITGNSPTMAGLVQKELSAYKLDWRYATRNGVFQSTASMIVSFE